VPPAAGGPPPAAAPPPAPPRVRQTAPLWIAALQEEIDRAGGRPLSLLLIELEDGERIVAAEGEDRAGATFAQFTSALRGVARGQDILVRETDTRALIIARDTGRDGATALGARVADAVAAATRWRGAPLIAAVGLAVLGEDAHTADELIGAAEEARFAASASGTGVGR
jgi:GGDEF domain-containing protein